MRAAPLLLLAVLAFSGCMEPHRVRVDDDVLAKADARWTETLLKMESEGRFGPKTKETQYAFDPGSGAVPFPGIMQVFSIRETNRRSTDALLEWTQNVVDDAAREESIAIDPEGSGEGQRRLAGGVRTHYFVREGTVTNEDADSLFSADSRVRILGEVGYDGSSSTSFVVVAIAEIRRSVSCPILVSCNDETSLATWVQIAGDPEGSIGGAVSDTGFVDNLVTH